jgi:hypothetical protein
MEPDRRAEKAGHRLDNGAGLQMGPQGERRYTITCSCGWVSEACGTAVLAEADGEQHVTFALTRRTTGREAT